MKSDIAVIVKKRRISTNRKTKTETITKPKNFIDLGKELPIFSVVSNVIWNI